jgi:hypothetical protein
MVPMSVQCHLRRGKERMTSWIPKRYAIVGRYIKLKSEDGSWEDGWKVHQTYAELPTKIVLERGQDYRNTRKASDV